MGLFGEMAFGSTAFGDTGDIAQQDRGRLWNIISGELRVTGGRHPLQTTVLGQFLRMSSAMVLPDELQIYLANLVDKKLKPRQGRRKSADISSRNVMIRNLYPALLRQYQLQRSGELSNVPRVGDAPHILAAKQVVEEIRCQGYPMVAYTEILNIMSSEEMH